ncbi:structural maintenance of chromosomes protein 6-like [Anguilla rostrata]|uniref:structural maintenance of chromosomes protein 6-like n=1 Tax=Anguilla rostrata TaxID=7938 RepID=UPI0030CEA14C
MSKRKHRSSDESNHKRARSEQVDDDSEDEEEMVGPSQATLTTAPSVKTCGEVGLVESISLRNFMCHSLLGPFSFGDNVNFVIGNNGSGKSAILTALIVGLGGKATTTNRGSSVKGFVKEGESSADVCIKLRNRGQDAYKPEVFGPSINVELRISSEGLRTYKLKSKTGQVVSTKKEELVSILDHFNIQVDNPVSILTQEMSKHFLHSKGEGDKYKFFMKATQLEQMKEDYTYIMKTKTVTKNTIEKHEECLEVLKRKFLEKEDKYKSLASLDEMHAKLQELKNQMAWALVAEMKKEVKPLRERITGEEKGTIKYDQKVEEWKAKVVEAEQKYKQIHDQLESISERVQQLQPQCIELKSQAQECSKAYKAAETSVHRIKTNLRDLEKDKEQLTKRISELKHSISQSRAADTQERVERISRLQAELEALNHQDSTLNQQIDQFQQVVARRREELARIEREKQELSSSMDLKRRALKSMQASRTDRIRRFGDQMPNLLAAIDEAYGRGQFKKKPVGPLGYCIRLNDPELAVAVESCLKGLMMAFCCDNYHDERTLQGLMSRHYNNLKRPQIIVSEFSNAMYNISEKAVQHPEYPTVLQALEVQDPVVANCLIDMRGIETILLIKNNRDARQVMQQGQPPRNCREAFTMDGDQVYANRYYSSDHQRAPLLSRDVEEEIRHLETELANETTQVEHFRRQVQVVQGDIQQNNALLKRAHEERKRAQDKSRKLRLEIGDLQNVEEPQSEDLRPLEEELQEICEKIVVARGESEAARQRASQLKKTSEEAETKYRQHKDSISSITEEADPIKDELSKSDQEVEKSKHHKRHYEEKRRAHIDGIQKQKADLNTKERELMEAIEKATAICPELEVRRTAKSLDNEISRLRQKISTQQNQHGDRDEILRQYQEALENYKNVALQVKNLKKFTELLSKIMNDRHRVYTELRMYLSVRCKYYFDSMLSQRGYTGKMTFDHKNETLAISVQPGEGDKAALNDMRSLSGGERSFSTVCFVLSLWAIAEAPFRCLDEFDVYMDMVNRKISLDMMLRIATNQRFRQFIFLTPQNTSSLPLSSLIRVHQLKDPDRTQTVLPFGQGNREEAEG